MVRAIFTLCGAGILVLLSPTSVALAADVMCYVDSVLGDDTKTGLTEADAVKTQAKIGSTCTVVKYKRGSVFPEEAVKISNKVKVYTNYGEAGLPLPRFEKTRAPNNGSIVSSYQALAAADRQAPEEAAPTRPPRMGARRAGVAAVSASRMAARAWGSACSASPC